jgi:hypothetical protein
MSEILKFKYTPFATREYTEHTFDVDTSELIWEETTTNMDVIDSRKYYLVTSPMFNKPMVLCSSEMTDIPGMEKSYMYYVINIDNDDMLKQVPLGILDRIRK